MNPSEINSFAPLQEDLWATVDAQLQQKGAGIHRETALKHMIDQFLLSGQFSWAALGAAMASLGEGAPLEEGLGLAALRDRVLSLVTRMPGGMTPK